MLDYGETQSNNHNTKDGKNEKDINPVYIFQILYKLKLLYGDYIIHYHCFNSK